MSPEYRIGRLNGRFTVSWWIDGKRRRYRLDARTRADAEREAIDLIRNQVKTPEGATVADLWEAYRREKVGRRVATGMFHEGKAVLPHFGHLRPDQVSVDLCRAYTALRRSQGKSDGTVWTELGHLRTVLVWAVKRRFVNFAPEVERPQKPAPKDRWLNDEEIERLLAAPAAHHIRLAIILMLATAARVGAILDLRWDRVDFRDGGQIDLRVSDIGPRKGRAVVPMNAMARAALQVAREAAQSEFVIEWAGGPVQSIKTGFYAAVRAAGLDISPHDLRRTAAIHLVAAGTPMQKVAQYLGHTNTSVTFAVYGRYQPDHLREEADILDFTKLREVK